MLVLSRKIGEQIVIGKGTIEITIVRIKGNQVALGFNAPMDMSIHRKEIYQKIMAEESQKTV